MTEAVWVRAWRAARARLRRARRAYAAATKEEAAAWRLIQKLASKTPPNQTKNVIRWKAER